MLHNPDLKPPQQLRFLCRNLKCKARLKIPTDNSRDAFRCSGCEERFYSRRCRVCEQLFSRKTSRRIVCTSEKCRSRYKRHPEQYALRLAGANPAHNAPQTGLPSQTSQNSLLAHNASRSAHSTGLKTDLESGRGWRVVAGPADDLHPINLLIDPADPKIKASNAANARYWRQARQAAGRKALIQRDTPPVNLVGGYRFPNAAAVDLGSSGAAPRIPTSITSTEFIEDESGIPPFLRRALWKGDAS